MTKARRKTESVKRCRRGLRARAVRNCWGTWGGNCYHVGVIDRDGEWKRLNRAPTFVQEWCVQRWIDYAWRVVRRYERVMGIGGVEKAVAA